MCRELLQLSRLVSFSAHSSQRLYPQWAVRVLSLSALPKGEVYQTQDPLEATVSSDVLCMSTVPSDCVCVCVCVLLQVAGSLECLYKLGVHLSKLTQVKCVGVVFV